MSNVTVAGLLTVRRNELRAKAERQHHLSNELKTKTGVTYTYRGVQYSYE